MIAPVLFVTGRAECADCGQEWVAVWPLGCDALECPACHGTNTDREPASKPEPVRGMGRMGLH